MFGYLREAGDKSFDELPFNGIDNLILSQLAYCGYEDCVLQLPCSLKYLDEKVTYGVNPKNRELFDLVSQSRRFRESIVIEYVSEFSEESTIQFAAVTFLLSDGTAYVSFRGTDSTLVGWKEDFLLCVEREVPAQKRAVQYLESISELLTCPLRVGGHSKGGNLAVYSSAFCNDDARKYITEIYSNDGPGFLEEIVRSKEYQAIKTLIHKFVPESSVIGMLLNDEANRTVVDSSSIGILQHDPYTWKTEGVSFLTKPATNTHSAIMDDAFTKWLSGMDRDKRRFMADTLFEIAEAGKAKTLRDLMTKPNAIPGAISAIANLNPDDRKQILGIGEALLKAMGSSGKDKLKDIIDDTGASILKLIGSEGKKNG